MEYYQFNFPATSDEIKNELIALLSNIGFEGFEETDSHLEAFVSADKFDSQLFNKLIKDTAIPYSKSIIEEKNWNEEWERSFSPVLVDHPVSKQPFAAVRANFHDAINVPHDIIVTPKMSFGTGHHATTYLMMQQMSLLVFKGKSVIDYGTGTAVLAILAEKQGASSVIAIDNDDWSINNAVENIQANNCTKISLVKGETVEIKMKADIILANINLNIIIANLSNIKAACNLGAAIVFSGVLENDKQEISAALSSHGFYINQIVVKNNWMVIVTSI